MRYSLTCCVTLLVLLVAGCADDSGTTDVDTTDDPMTEEPADDADDTEDTADADDTDDVADAGAATVSTAQGPGGEVLVDGEGLSLYLFENDDQGESTCTADCTTTWPPLTTTGEPTAEGSADQGALGTITREDGSTQVTYNDWPLYHYAGDSGAGDTEGQGVGDVWWLGNAVGEPVRDAE